MEIANIVFRFMGASQVLLFLCMIAMSSNPARVRVLGVLLTTGIFCYLTTPLYMIYMLYIGLNDSSDCSGFMWYFASIVPALLLLFVWSIFEEHQPMPFWLILLSASSMLLSASVHLSLAGVFDVYGLKLPAHIMKIVLVFVTLCLVWHGREADLVEQRVKYRTIFIVVVATLVLAVIVVELLTGFVVPAVLELSGVVLIAATTFIFNVYVFYSHSSLQLVLPVAVPREDCDDGVINVLLSRMKDERLYADHDLRVGSLASIMGMPEYQLRKRINQQLGYRNFNEFVNRYRIEEAGSRLLQDMKMPVLSIALDVGFRSISSFNTVFHAHFGVSPTQYRSESTLLS